VANRRGAAARSSSQRFTSSSIIEEDDNRGVDDFEVSLLGDEFTGGKAGGGTNLRQVEFYPCIETSQFLVNKILNPPMLSLTLQSGVTAVLLVYFGVSALINKTTGLSPHDRFQIAYFRLFNTGSSVGLLVDSLFAYTYQYQSMNMGSGYKKALLSLVAPIRRLFSLCTNRCDDPYRDDPVIPNRTFLFIALFLLLPGLVDNVIPAFFLQLPMNLLFAALYFLTAVVYQRCDFSGNNVRALVGHAGLRLTITFLTQVFLQMSYNSIAYQYSVSGSRTGDSLSDGYFGNMGKRLSAEYHSRSMPCAAEMLENTVSQLQMIFNF
jgi:hypothetical protein